MGRRSHVLYLGDPKPPCLLSRLRSSLRGDEADSTGPLTDTCIEPTCFQQAFRLSQSCSVAILADKTPEGPSLKRIVDPGSRLLGTSQHSTTGPYRMVTNRHKLLCPAEQYDIAFTIYAVSLLCFNLRVNSLISVMSAFPMLHCAMRSRSFSRPRVDQTLFS